MTMTLISTVTTSGTTYDITFSSIPQTGTDLYVVCSLRSIQSALDFFKIVPNGVAPTHRWLYGNGSSASSSTNATQLTNVIPGSSYTGSTFGNISAYIPNYTGSTQKSISIDAVAENNATATGMAISAALSSTTSPITGLNISMYDAFAAGSTVSLYTITKGSGGATVS
jgi:hypothetical protein